MNTIDEACAEYFLKEQLKLFPKPVVESVDEAMEFLEDCLACVFDSKEELEEYVESEGIDCGEDDICDALEVFSLPDGRYMYVEA